MDFFWGFLSYAHQGLNSLKHARRTCQVVSQRFTARTYGKVAKRCRILSTRYLQIFDGTDCFLCGVPMLLPFRFRRAPRRRQRHLADGGVLIGREWIL